MHQDPDGGFPSDAATLSFPETVSSPDLEESVAQLDCRERKTSQVYRSAELLLRRVSGRRGDLFLILRHLERVDGSLTGFVLGLESILRQSPVRVILGDPSGVVPLVLPAPARSPQFRLAWSSPVRKRILILDPAQESAVILQTVLEAYGHCCTILHSTSEARQMLSLDAHDLVLLDLEFPRLHSFGIAQFMAERQSKATLVGLTEREDVWNPENMLRYGFRRILSKPYSAVEILEMASKARLD